MKNLVFAALLPGVLATAPAFSQEEPVIANWAAPPYWVPPAQIGLPPPGAFTEANDRHGSRQALALPSPPLPFVAITPCRRYDSRSFSPLLENTPRVVTLTGGACGIPPSAQAASVNITVFDITGAGSNGVFKLGTAVPPATAWINYPPTETQRANAGVVALTGAGEIVVQVNQGAGSVDFTVDVNGYFAGNVGLMLPYTGTASVVWPGAAFDVTNTGAGIAVHGTSASSFGLVGSSTTWTGIFGSSNSGFGVQGRSTSSYGVEGESSSSDGVLGTTAATDEVSAGVRGTSTATFGIVGTSTSWTGVYGGSTSGDGVHGKSTSADGVWGQTSGAGKSGVYGSNSDAAGYGVYGRNDNSGSFGYLGGGSGTVGGAAGVYGNSSIGNAGFFAGTVLVTSLAGSGNRAVYSDATGVLTNSTSDARLKTGVVTLSEEIDVLSVLGRLRGVEFCWDTSQERSRNLGSQREIGLIAQEVEPVLPELVSVNADGYKSIDYPKLTAFLIEVAKAQQKQIAGQQHRIDELTALVTRLSATR